MIMPTHRRSHELLELPEHAACTQPCDGRSWKAEVDMALCERAEHVPFWEP